MSGHVRGRALAAVAILAGLSACSSESPDPAGDAAADDGAAGDAASDTAVDGAAVDGTNGPDGLALPAGGVGVTRTEQRPDCAHRNPLRNVYFGDLHVHTRLSFDAWVNDVRTTPAQAYSFARGASVRLPPLDENGMGTREVSLGRPLDFSAVTDHAELLAETALCADPESAAGALKRCAKFREDKDVTQLALSISAVDPVRYAEICGETGAICADAAGELWSEIQAAAEDAYDRTEACEFTSFVAYEYSASPNVSNLHRNVLFRNADVPLAPITYFEAPTAQSLWAQLREQCIDRDGACDVLAIPHNSNWSNGRMFLTEYPGAESDEDRRRQAAERREMEPLVEIFQHKGDSECSSELQLGVGATDEQCGFEKLREGAEDCGDGVGAGGMIGLGCIAPRDFLREALLVGLEQEAILGENPYRFGFVGSTDTHNGTPGSVSERTWPGHVGADDATAKLRLDPPGVLPGGIIDNPGGLVAAWSAENSRDALFEAFRRRETYATSGPRMVVRFFGGWELPADLCSDADYVTRAYATGVPMGAVLPAASGSAALDAGPRFVVQAQQDPGTAAEPGAPLQQIQIVKGWIEGGELREQVFDVAGSSDATPPNVDTCEIDETQGHASLCATWVDPSWAPGQRAFYYARILEVPTCRWHRWLCLGLAAEERPEACDSSSVPDAIQERAWTSPIWTSAD